MFGSSTRGTYKYNKKNFVYKGKSTNIKLYLKEAKIQNEFFLSKIIEYQLNNNKQEIR